MTLRNTTAVEETVKVNLREFKEKMSKSAPTNIEIRTTQQLKLVSTVRMIFRQEGEEFNYCFGLLEKWVAENINDAMATNRRFSGLEYAKQLSREDLTAAMMVINLLCMIAQPNSRQLVLARYDFGRIGKIWTTNNSGDKLTAYFAG